MAGIMDIVILGAVAVGGYFVYTNCLVEGGTCWDLFGHGDSPPACDPATDPTCKPDGNGTSKTCDQFGGDCNSACLHGCEGANCVACLTACGKSCSDTGSTESCSFTCDNSYCRSFADKGCSQNCANCKGSGLAMSMALVSSPGYHRPRAISNQVSRMLNSGGMRNVWRV